MLQVFVNNERLDFKTEKEENIGQLLGEIEAFCNKNGHTIYKIFLGDEELSVEKLDALFERAINSNLELNLFTLSAETIKENLNEAVKLFSSQSESLKDVGVKMQTNDDIFVLNLITEISQTVKEVFEYLRLLKILNISNSVLKTESLLESQKQINDFLNEIATALEEKDIITVSDLSEYELSPLLDSLGKELSILVGM